MGVGDVYPAFFRSFVGLEMMELHFPESPSLCVSRLQLAKKKKKKKKKKPELWGAEVKGGFLNS